MALPSISLDPATGKLPRWGMTDSHTCDGLLPSALKPLATRECAIYRIGALAVFIHFLFLSRLEKLLIISRHVHLISQTPQNLRWSEMHFQGRLIDGASVFFRRKRSEQLSTRQTLVCERALKIVGAFPIFQCSEQDVPRPISSLTLVSFSRTWQRKRQIRGRAEVPQPPTEATWTSLTS